jgi:outer membrane murein-binding lipoprotein Lpp
MTRLTAEQETRGAQLYAGGATERDVAEALSCSPSTAHRLRERLDGGPAEPGGQEDGAVDELTRQRDELAARVAALEARAEAARSQVATIELERREALARADDGASFAGRRRQALEEAEDAAESARVLSGEVARIEQQLAEDADRRELARQRDELAAAIAERDAVYAASGDRQRAAVLAVRDAAAGWVAVYTDERRTAGRVEQLAAEVTERAQRLGGPLPAVAPPASTRLTVSPAESYSGGAGLALEQAAYAAQEGPSRAPRVAELLGRANGWLPAGAAEQSGPQVAGQALPGGGPQ